MLLTDEQRDALTELINIGFARTASSLSELTGYRVLLEVPQVSIHPIHELFDKLSGFVEGEVATVQQIFTGPVSGNAILLLNYHGALMLTDLLMPEGSPPIYRLDASASEVLTEIGNILLNACLSIFGNLLQISISFSVPQLHLEAIDVLIKSLLIGKEEVRYGIVIYTAFHLRDNAVTGYLIMVLSITSLDSLIAAVNEWAEIS